MGERSPTGSLRQEHQGLLSDIKNLEAAVRALGATAATSWESVGGTIRDRLEMFHRGLVLHFRREEEGLFPDVREIVSKGAPRADVLGQFFAGEAEEDIGAHAALAGRLQEAMALVDQFARAPTIDQGSAGRLRTLISLTRGLLERHAAREDALVFPMIERSLDVDQVEAVRQRMNAFRAAADLTGGAPDEGLRDLSMEDSD
jgi:hemerythrin-like domain-containing protein